MLKKRMDAYKTIQPLFQAVERSTDRAATEAATCIAEMLKARTDANLPLGAGTDMLDKMVAALTANVAARRLLIEAHALTPALIKGLGLERMFGDESPCPKTAFADTGGDVVPIGIAA